MQADDKTKRGKSERNAFFFSQIKKKIGQSLLCIHVRIRNFQLVGITASTERGDSTKPLLPLTQTRLKPHLLFSMSDGEEFVLF